MPAACLPDFCTPDVWPCMGACGSSWHDQNITIYINLYKIISIYINLRICISNLVDVILKYIKKYKNILKYIKIY